MFSFATKSYKTILFRSRARRASAVLALAFAAVPVFSTHVVIASDDVARTMTAGPAVWSRYSEISGIDSVNTGQEAKILSVSCSSAGNCTAGGYYRTQVAYTYSVAFVATQTDGVWGPQLPIPSMPVPAGPQEAKVSSVSCSSAGNCTVGGQYLDNIGYQAFVATQTNGSWGTFSVIPGLNALNTGGNANVVSVSCSSAGNCTVGGQYQNSIGYQAFVATQTNGSWGTYSVIPGLYAINIGGNANVASVSCSSAGNCTVGGYYQTQSGVQAFVATQTNGTFSTYSHIPGLNAANSGNYASVASVSCSSAGNCSVGGGFYGLNGGQGFVASQINGIWGSFSQIDGVQALAVNGGRVTSISCVATGYCTASGYYTSATFKVTTFVATQTNGVWSSYSHIPGLNAAATDNRSTPNSLSCTSAGNCTIGGTYYNGKDRAFVATQNNGQWDTYAEIPNLNDDSLKAEPTSISCSSASNCTVGGFLKTSTGFKPFVASVSTSTAPSSPAGVSATSNENGQSTVSWGAPMSNGGIAITSYKAIVVGDPDKFCTATVTELSCIITGLTNGTPYTFTVTATNVVGTSNPSTASDTATPIAPSTSTTTTTTTTSTVAPILLTTAATPTTTTSALVTTMTDITTTTQLPALPSETTIKGLKSISLVTETALKSEGQVSVTAGGFASMEFVQLIVASRPQVIASGYADTRGFVTLTGLLPSSLELGQHTLALYAPKSGVGFRQAITVSQASLPKTGSNVPVLVLLAITILMTGLVVRRYRIFLAR